MATDPASEQTAGDPGTPRVARLAELEHLVAERPGLYVRYSRGPEHDAHEQSWDSESGLPLPGLSVNPLEPESWWTRPLMDWLARQVCQYQELQAKNPDRVAWVLTGREVGRGPDCEPLLVDVETVALIEPSLLDEAMGVYEERFDARRGPED